MRPCHRLVSSLTPNHRLLTSGGWTRLDRLRAGDALVRPDAGAQGSTVLAVEPTSRVESVFNLGTTGEHSYIVDGLVAHNFTHLRWLRSWWHRLVLDGRALASGLELVPERDALTESSIGQRPAPRLERQAAS